MEWRHDSNRARQGGSTVQGAGGFGSATTTGYSSATGSAKHATSNHHLPASIGNARSCKDGSSARGGQPVIVRDLECLTSQRGSRWFRYRDGFEAAERAILLMLSRSSTVCVRRPNSSSSEQQVA